MIIQVGVASLLLYAGAAKLLTAGEFRAALGHTLRDRYARVIAGAVIASEIVIGLAVLAGDGDVLVVSLIAAALLFGAFSAWVVSVLVRHIELSCPCFGSGRRLVARSTLARNAVLVGICVVGAAGAHMTSEASNDVVPRLVIGSSAACLALLAAEVQNARRGLVLTAKELDEQVITVLAKLGSNR